MNVKFLNISIFKRYLCIHQGNFPQSSELSFLTSKYYTITPSFWECVLHTHTYTCTQHTQTCTHCVWRHVFFKCDWNRLSDLMPFLLTATWLESYWWDLVQFMGKRGESNHMTASTFISPAGESPCANIYSDIFKIRYSICGDVWVPSHKDKARAAWHFVSVAGYLGYKGH